jgi:hypothetical protein
LCPVDAPRRLWVTRRRAPIIRPSVPTPVTSEARVPTDEKPRGPASYFPSIEKTYGQPIAHWLELTRSRQEMKHMELVSRLKTEHGLGHGHANAIVAYVRAEAK